MSAHDGAYGPLYAMSAMTDLTSLSAPSLPSFDPTEALARELQLPRTGVGSVLKLLTEGATVPFIARYRKEATGGLDEVQIRDIDERRTYLAELHERKQSVLEAIAEQGKLTRELLNQIVGASTKARVEDLFAPYKKKRRTRAVIARERGLEPLALLILGQGLQGVPTTEAGVFLGSEVATVDDALAGARDIVAEMVAERAEVRGLARETFEREGVLVTEATDEAKKQRTKFEQYYDFREPVAKMPSHRYLAIRRGEKEGMLRADIDIDAVRLADRVTAVVGVEPRSPWAPQLRQAVEDGCKRLLLPSIETDLRVELKLRSDVDAVDIFASNLRNLLLSAPAGEKAIVGIDPGLRTGCKCVALDATGKMLEYITVFPALGEQKAQQAAVDLARFVKKYAPFAIAIGNGTGGRETETFAKQVLRDNAISDVLVVPVNEAGASVYSASDVAREEFPELDLTIRGAISIGRRMQDPLAELVKIDPKAIGVGQYQHDVHQPLLQRKLSDVVESCVNHVGVELNTASAPLLSYVAGIGPGTAKKIIEFRQQNGAFRSRKQLLQVPGLGPRTFEQCAGFIRLRSSEHPLDASAVHPERYALVERMASDLGVPLKSLVGNASLATSIPLDRYVSEDVGLPTLRDIVSELAKPGRDPRESFEPPKFRDDVNSMEDLRVGMSLEGVVTNVTAFGAFVDVGVHQDGLVHVSHLSDTFVRDPAQVVKAGDRISVRVMEVDVSRRRISLTARSGELDELRAGAQRAPEPRPQDTRGGHSGGGQRPAPHQSQGGGRSGDGGNRQGGGRPQDRKPQQQQPAKESLDNRPFASLLKR